jgi:hypothetical protein
MNFPGPRDQARADGKADIDRARDGFRHRKFDQQLGAVVDGRDRCANGEIIALLQIGQAHDAGERRLDDGAVEFVLSATQGSVGHFESGLRF